MANCHTLFQDFHGNIRILSSKRTRMISSREACRKKIIKWFKENHPDYVPKFYIQGSQKNYTGISYNDDTCDMDDGVYFLRELKEGDTSDDLQKWVFEALEDQTNEPTIRKKNCGRVPYKSDYHIDYPVYKKSDQDNHPYLVVKENGFKEDDPKEFVEWLNKAKDNEQKLIRIIKYLKAWCDNKTTNTFRMLNGVSLTVLAEKCIKYNDRDDIMLKDTLEGIKTELDNEWECLMPTTPFDDLLIGYTELERQNFKSELNIFIKDAKEALDTSDKSKASKLWIKHLGIRFPEYKDDNLSKEYSSIALAGIASQNRPYSN